MGDTFGIHDDDAWYCMPNDTRPFRKGADAPGFVLRTFEDAFGLDAHLGHAADSAVRPMTALFATKEHPASEGTEV